MDKIKRIREAMATGRSILTDIEKVLITENAKVLGMSSKYHIERLLAKVVTYSMLPSLCMSHHTPTLELYME